MKGSGMAISSPSSPNQIQYEMSLSVSAAFSAFLSAMAHKIHKKCKILVEIRHSQREQFRANIVGRGRRVFWPITDTVMETCIFLHRCLPSAISKSLFPTQDDFISNAPLKPSPALRNGIPFTLAPTINHVLGLCSPKHQIS